MPSAQAIKNLKFAYLSVFIVLFLLATAAQITIQLALHHESISRQASTILASNVLAEQRLQESDVLLITPGSHTSDVAVMQAQIKVLQYNHVTFTQNYLSTYPAISTAHVPSPTPYERVMADAKAIIADETRTPALTQAQRIKMEFPYVTRLFYDSDAHLELVVRAERIVDNDTDTYILLIQRIEATLYLLTVLTLGAEFVFVVLPANRRLRVVASDVQRQKQEQDA